MPLKLDVIVQAIHEMAQEFEGAREGHRLDAALDALRTLRAAEVRERLDDARARPAWLVAYPIDGLAGRHPLPPIPEAFTVVGTDGSYIAPDRHSPIRFFIINTGYALLTYGDEPTALLDAETHLYHGKDEVYVSPEHETQPIEGALLALKMAIEEMNTLVKITTAAPARPVVALRDGTLILWGLDSPGIKDEVRDRFLDPYREALEEMRRRQVPLAAYVSYPGSDDVINALRVGVCPDEPVICSRCTTRETEGRPRCADFAMLIDRGVFWRHLRPGERSDLFLSRQPVLKYYGDEHKVHFFYLHTGTEIARVEIPAWVARSAELVNQVHAIVYDQCRRGNSYPPALVEAHEQAVITTAERRLVEELVARELAGVEIDYIRSEKDRSKRVRGV